MSEQNYSNHAQMVPGFHYVLFGVSFLTLIGAGVNYFGAMGTEGAYSAALIFVLTFAVLVTMFYGRLFALKAQDRAIRAEENLRHFARKGTLMDAKITMRQIIALRFAPDEEWDDLAKKAVANNMSEKEIKQAIENWKADTYRV